MSILDIAQTAEDVKDSSGGGDFKPPREGVALLRMCSYVELGVHEGEWKGKIKHNKKCLVEFELLHPDHKITGADGSFKGYHKVMIRLNKSGHAKSKYMALFNKLNYDGEVYYDKDTIPALSKFLGKAYLGQIVHNEYKGKVYANLDKDGDFQISAPRNQLVEMGVPTGKYEDIPVPEMSVPPRLFLWEAPNITNAQYHEMWDSIYIDGEKEDGSSKNWIQNLIISDENIALPGSKAEELFTKASGLSDLTLSDPSLA